jgi:SAM-dependent methyltransferase
MPSVAVLKQVLVELTSAKTAHRTPEPSLVMDDPAQVAAFREAGLEDGVMAPVYLFHCAQVCAIVQPGDTVLDLGCGPANQLAMIARLNPEARFIGIDLSDEMLARAQDAVAAQGLRNVAFRRADITRLEVVGDRSVDAVYSTMVLHHLPGSAELKEAFRQVGRVLKPGGGIYLVDFGHLKTAQAIRYFAHQYADRQPPLFTVDYLNSLSAAFEVADWKAAFRHHLADRAKLYSTFLVPYMVAVKSAPRAELTAAVRASLSELRERLPAHHQRDFRDLRTFFRLGGLRAAAFD